MKKKKYGKKWMVVFMAAILAAGLYGCGGQTEPASELTAEQTEMEAEQGEEAKTEDTEADAEPAEDDAQEKDTTKAEEQETAADEQTVQTEAGVYTISMQNKDDVQTSEDGSVTYIETVKSYPQVTNETNPQAADKINAYFTALMDTTNSDSTDTLEWAKEDYDMRLEQAKADGEEVYWEPYYSETVFANVRADEGVVCFTGNVYEYTGGAHGNHVTYGVTFDSHTGEKLTLADLTEDEAAAKAFIEEQITLQAQEIQDKAASGESEIMLFEEYQDYIPDVLTEDSWFLTEDGMEIVANEYLLAPYAAGAITFTIPYDQCEFMKEEYKK